MHTFRTDTRAPACVPVRCPQALEAGGAFGTAAHCSAVYDLEGELGAGESEDEAHGGEPSVDDAEATGYADRVKRARAARAAVTNRLSDEQRGEVNAACEAVLTRPSEGAGPLQSYDSDASSDVTIAFARLKAKKPSYWESLDDPEAADRFVLAFLNRSPLIVEQILHPEREVPLDSLPLATHRTGSYVIVTDADTAKVAAYLRARPSKGTVQQRGVLGCKLSKAEAAGMTRLSERYGGKTAQNKVRQPAHVVGSEQLCDTTARLLEQECGGVTVFKEMATVAEIAELGRQAGVSVNEALSLAEVVTVEGLGLMTRDGNLNVARPGCVSVATSVSVAGGRVVRAAGGITLSRPRCGIASRR